MLGTHEEAEDGGGNDNIDGNKVGGGMDVRFAYAVGGKEVETNGGSRMGEVVGDEIAWFNNGETVMEGCEVGPCS